MRWRRLGWGGVHRRAFYVVDGSGISPARYRQILNHYCNRFGWEKAVVDCAKDEEMLGEWADERAMALNAGEDYRTLKALI